MMTQSMCLLLLLVAGLTSAFSAIQTAIKPRNPGAALFTKKPPRNLVLYRDTNGWCPFCERTWLFLRLTSTPYSEKLINLRNKPEYYLKLVPTTLVPAIQFDVHASRDADMIETLTTDPTFSNVTKIVNRRNPISRFILRKKRVVMWESTQTMQAIDAFLSPQSKAKMFLPETLTKVRAEEVVADVSKTGFSLNYPRGFGNSTSDPTSTAEERRSNFGGALTALDQHLTSAGGPFLLGSLPTASDVSIVPTLERLRHQLPITQSYTVYSEEYPGIKRWFDAMEGLEAYEGRVAGDEVSWLSTIPVFARMFAGKDGMSKENEEKAVRAEARVESLLKELEGADLNSVGAKYREEAAAKVLGNRKAIIADISNQDPKSQKHIPRLALPSHPAVSEMLDAAVDALLLADLGRPAQAVAAENLGAARDAARIMAQRLCAPRDMSAPAAKALRIALLSI